MSTVTLDHLSHSQVNSFTSCPRKWHYDKIERAPRERLPATLAFGIAVHDVLAEVNERSIHGDTIDAKAAFITAWKAQVASAAAPIYYGKDSADDLLSKGQALVTAYVPPSGIIGVEQPFTVELDPDLPPIEGRIDVIRRDITGNLIVSDLKTSASKVLTDTNGIEAQLALYDVAYPAAGHEAIVLGKLKTPTITLQPITPWPFARLRQHYIEVHAAMEAGVRFANRGWQCDGCQFAERCRRDSCS